MTIDAHSQIDPATDRRNGNLFLWSTLVNYFAAPVFYVGVVQAALCDQLGSSASVANLPTVGNTIGSFAPLAFASFVPHRWERGMVVLTAGAIVALVGGVAVSLCSPVSNQVLIAIVVGQGLILGILNFVNQLFLFQCLGRGTTETGRIRALKYTYSLGPLAAVAGSVAAQFILRGHLAFLPFPRNFAVLYAIAVPCGCVAIWCSGRFELLPLADEASVPLVRSMWENINRFRLSRRMVLLWFAYACWYAAFSALPNLSLFTKKALGREPSEFSGIITGIQFGAKAAAGYAMGVLSARRGLRAPLLATILALGASILWAWNVSGYFFLATFAFIGVGQLGAIYFQNALLTWSPSKRATQDLSVLALAMLATSPVPAIYGMIADRWGFSASFALGLGFVAVALVLTLRIARQTHPASALAS